MTLPEKDPPDERTKARLPKDSAALRETGATSGAGFRVEPRSSVPARTVVAPRTELAPRTDLSPRVPGEPRHGGPAGSPDEGDAEEPPADR